MNSSTLQAIPRTAKGKAASGRLRRAGWVPAVVYGQGKPGRDIQLNSHDFGMTLRRHRSENMIVDLTVEGEDKPAKVMLKALQHDPLTGRIIHADFCEVSMTKRIEVEIPITLVGDAYGVLNEGGILEHVLRMLPVRCLATDIVEEFQLDVSGLHVGDSCFIRDLKIDTAKYEIEDDLDQVIATVAAPRKEAEPEAEAAEGKEAAEAAGPEVMTETKAAEKAAAEAAKKAEK